MAVNGQDGRDDNLPPAGQILKVISRHRNGLAQHKPNELGFEHHRVRPLTPGLLNQRRHAASKPTVDPDDHRAHSCRPRSDRGYGIVRDRVKRRPPSGFHASKAASLHLHLLIGPTCVSQTRGPDRCSPATLQNPAPPSVSAQGCRSSASDPAIECCRVARHLLRRFAGQLDRDERCSVGSAGDVRPTELRGLRARAIYPRSHPPRPAGIRGRSLRITQRDCAVARSAAAARHGNR